MVSTVSNRLAAKRGLIDFILQRLTAVVLGIYVIHLTLVFALNGDMDYTAWRSYFNSGYSLLLASLTIVCVVLHGWIGMWTIGTDYLIGSPIKRAARVIYQLIVVFILAAYLVFSMMLIWGYL
ncbi:MAG: succinate dehydrogenase, hydrophobic membrane anchor protein [Gammaproteobacteria bacterium]|nr:succinate dehydrogenase, hydrophobic membrane anchor protein [Gammaproteobacteria bacterium]